MTPAAGGRYCAHCQKTVVDFSRMNDAAFLNHVQRFGLGCGILRADQTIRMIEEPAYYYNRVAKVMLGIGLLLGIRQGASGQARDSLKAELLSINAPDNHPAEQNRSIPKQDSITITGSLTDESGSPITDAVIIVSDTANNSIADGLTDFDGNFLVKTDFREDACFSLTADFLYHRETKIIRPVAGINEYKMILSVNPSAFDGARVVGMIRYRRPKFFKRQL